MKEIKWVFNIIAVFLILFCTKNSLASPQLPDYIIYKADTIPIYNLLLEQYLQKIDKNSQGSLFGLEFRSGASLNCWRGYQAIYTIENDSLFLKEIIGCGELQSGNSIDQEASQQRLIDIFGEQVIKGKVFLDWYSGEFSLSKENLLRWDGVFHKTFEKETLVQVEGGKVKSITAITNYEDAPDRIDRRYDDKIADILFKELEKIKWKSIDKFDCSEKFLITIGTDGRISRVTMADYQTREDVKDYWDMNEYNYCIRTIRKGLKGLKFDILKINGKPIEETILVEIWLEDDGKLENWTN
ncbi:hypothetical protein [Pontibacter beigongshangensis]|uniref:hypothetical protein n=1 Tax=Pontibacter beigongshangensis TaxID=2574733 RepID=UPI001650BBF5|nr:hypothetical protein [Pontibacter beigongshangensis]